MISQKEMLGIIATEAHEAIAGSLHPAGSVAGESEHKLRGRKDYLAGKATFQNPYDEYTKERQEWIAGWCAQRYGN
jgi:ribosome modulation factor